MLPHITEDKEMKAAWLTWAYPYHSRFTDVQDPARCTQTLISISAQGAASHHWAPATPTAVTATFWGSAPLVSQPTSIPTNEGSQHAPCTPTSLTNEGSQHNPCTPTSPTNEGTQHTLYILQHNSVPSLCMQHTPRRVTMPLEHHIKPGPLFANKNGMGAAHGASLWTLWPPPYRVSVVRQWEWQLAWWSPDMSLFL